ncbi:MAG: hypothetical protein AVDCRST_MAG64-3811, partial [uncultured Phycisphaerae bacterium]
DSTQHDGVGGGTGGRAGREFGHHGRRAAQLAPAGRDLGGRDVPHGHRQDRRQQQRDRQRRPAPRDPGGAWPGCPRAPRPHPRARRRGVRLVRRVGRVGQDRPGHDEPLRRRLQPQGPQGGRGARPEGLPGSPRRHRRDQRPAHPEPTHPRPAAAHQPAGPAHQFRRHGL